MPIWFDADGQNARVAIYTGNDDAPLHNPTAYIGTRTKFHTSFNYIPFVPAKKITASVSIPANYNDGARGPLRRTINLGAHGVAGVPFIYGFAMVGGVARPLCGTVPVRVTTSGDDTINVVHWTLGVNNTNVFISEGRNRPGVGSGAINVNVEVYISDKVVL